MIYPKENKEEKHEMLQLSGKSKKVEMAMEGKERIYSRKDTKAMVSMAKEAKSPRDFMKLGLYVYNATKTQDSKAPEYTKN